MIRLTEAAESFGDMCIGLILQNLSFHCFVVHVLLYSITLKLCCFILVLNHISSSCTMHLSLIS